MKKACRYLRGKEWSMGNGQCPECQGVPPRWIGHPCHRNAESIGHTKDCFLAGALEDLGEKVFFLGGYVPSDRTRHLLNTYTTRHPDGELGSWGFLKELFTIFGQTNEDIPS